MFLHAMKSILRYFTAKNAIENKHPRNDIFFSTDNALLPRGRGKKLMTFLAGRVRA